MDKKEISLVQKFKKLEGQLLSALNEVKIEDIEKLTKTQLKSFVKKVAKAGKLFDEYEAVALDIEKLTQAELEDANSKLELAGAVVNFRETSQEVQDEIEIINNTVSVVKKKKLKSNAKSKGE